MAQKSNLLNNEGASISTVPLHGISFCGLPMSKFYTYPSNPVKTRLPRKMSAITLAAPGCEIRKPQNPQGRGLQRARTTRQMGGLR